MSAQPTPARLPGRVGFTVAALLAVLALVLSAVIALVIGRAVAGYTITPFAMADRVTVTVHDRSVALWMTPESAGANCTAINLATQQPSAHRGSADQVTVTDGGHHWVRLGLVEGPPGSRHSVSCTGYGTALPPELLGYSPNPRFAHYIVLGLVGGGAAGLAAVAAVVLLVVTAVRRSNAKRPAPT